MASSAFALTVAVAVLAGVAATAAGQDTNGTLTDVSRRGRQISWPGGLAPLGPCLSDRGEFGQCTSFRRCYPYFKLPELGTWETWVLGVYDTCTYLTSTGRQKFGVCCTNPAAQRPPAAAPPEIEEPSAAEGGGAIPPNWPPPIPTHPPDHTIPPLPTHPPSPGYPVEPTTTSTKKPVTTTKKPKPKPPKPPKPTKPPTPPPNWPPPIPTHPPTAQPWPPTVATKPPPTASPVIPTQPTHPPAIIEDASCGAKNGLQDQERIVGGQNADPNEWPWIAALFNSGRQFCGGSLIDSTHILTAAHCVAHMTSWDVARLTVRLGDHNIKTNSEVKHVEKRVKRVVRHRNFDMRTLYNDIAILTLDSPVTYSRTIHSVCLPSGTQARFDGVTATVIGWGSLRENGPQPAVLQEVNIPVWTNQECKMKYGNAAPGGIVEHFLCAGRATKDSCSGDSGGPLMVNTGGRWTQVGIVSWGIGCGKGQYPGVYTRVTHFMGWITKNLK